MKKLLTAALLLLPFHARAAEIVPTSEEEKAFMAGMMGMMARLEDPVWIKLAQENGEGCWLDKTTLVKEGATKDFEGVPSTCVSWNLGIDGKRGYMFFPTRLARACDQANLAYTECVQ